MPPLPGTPDVFGPVLSRLEPDVTAHYGLRQARLVPAGVEERPFSQLLRLQVCCGDDSRTVSHLFVKIYKPKPLPGGPDAMRDRVANDFEATRRVYAAMLPHGDVGAVPPVACYPDLLAIVTEQVDGPTLLEYLGKRAAWTRTGGAVDDLAETMRRVGRWIRIYQATDVREGQVTIEHLHAYIEHRLNRLVQHGAVTDGYRQRLLSHVDALGHTAAPEDLHEVAVHSDLALGNVIVSGTRIVVLDFAMAKRGTRLHDLTRLAVQLDLLSVKPQFGSRVIRRLQLAVLEGFDPALRMDRPMFRLLTLLHRVNHLTTLTVNRFSPAEAVYNALVRRRHRRWIAADLARGTGGPEIR